MEFGSSISYPPSTSFHFFLHIHGIRRYASIAVVFFLALHCIINIVSYLWFHSMHIKYVILIFYMRDTRWPTPPASGGMGSSPLRSETNAAYLAFSESVSQTSGHGNGPFTNILVKRAISSAETDGLVFFSTCRRCSSRISCYKRRKKKKKRKEGMLIRILGLGSEARLILYYYININIPLDDPRRP
jgi:hypothetical protein